MGSEWKETLLEDVADEVTVGFVGSMTSEYIQDGIPFLRSKNVSPYRIHWDDMKYISKEFHSKIKKSSLHPGDVVIVRTGKPGTATVVPDTIDEANCSDLVIVRPGSELDKGFLVYYLNSAAKDHINAHLVGAVQQHFNVGAAKKLSILLPPLPEQKAIAHVLGSLDKKIELNRRMNATLEGMAQALFKSWFVDFDPVIDNAIVAGNSIPEELTERVAIRREALDNGTANREIAKSFPASFQLTESMGWIPEGWEAVTLSQAIQINPSIKLSKGTVTPYAAMKALPTDGYTISGVIEKAYSGGAKFQNNDVLLARITPCLENGKTGIVDFLSSTISIGFGSTEFIVLRGQGELNLPYVACLARESNFRLHCMQSMVGSSGRQRVQNSCFENFHVACPIDLTLLKQFSKIAQPIFQKSSDLAKETHILSNLRDILLPQLISGELRTCHETERLDKEVLI